MGQTNGNLPARPDPAFIGLPKLTSIAGTSPTITGKLSFSAPSRIDGPLRGEIRSTALLVIGERGSVDGTVRAPELLILGAVRGEVRGAERIEIGCGGRLIGRIETRALVVNEGGILEAECLVAPKEG